MSLPLPAPHIWMIMSDCDITVGPSAQGSAPVRTSTWHYIKGRFWWIHLHTYTHQLWNGRSGVTSFLCFPSFCQDKFLNYTWRWLRWRRRDHILQELSLQVGMVPEREHEKELGEFSLQEAKRKGIRRRKDRTPVPIPQSSDSAQTDLRTQFFLFILFLCFLGYSSRTQQTNVLS